jgi:hypothetical protein
MNSDGTDNSGIDRAWDTVACVLLGHRWVTHTTYKLQADTGRALYGELCERCGNFRPTDGGKSRYVDTDTDQNGDRQ